MKHLSKKEREAYYPVILESYRLKSIRNIDRLPLDEQDKAYMKESINRSYLPKTA